MVLIVSNLKGPLLITLAYLDLIDAVLLTPSRYELPEAKTLPTLNDLPKYYETDFHSGTIKEKQLAELHTKFSNETDFVIAPDIRGNHEQSMVRFKEYLKYYKGEGRIIFPHQALTPDENLFNLAYEKEGLLGIPALTGGYITTVTPRSKTSIDVLIQECKDWGIPYHLLGFNPTRGWPRKFFTDAYSFDSQAILTYAKRYPSTFHVTQDGSWVEVDHRRTGIRPLSLATRMIMYHDHLRDWLSLPLPPQKKLEYYLENDPLKEVIL